MEDVAAFKAIFVRARQVRDDVIFEFSTPSEKATKCLELIGGYPKPGESRWCGIARLNPTEGVREEESRNGAVASADTMSPPQLSQILFLRLCKSPVGRRYQEEFHAGPGTVGGINTPEHAKQILKERLEVQSLSEVDSNPAASEKAEQMLNLFAGWERGL